MSDPLRISSQAIFYTKFIPCFHIEKDMLTVTNLSLETQIKNGDYFITGDDCLELIMSPIINKKHTNYEDNRRMNYDNMVIKYSEFPGMKNPDLAKRKDVFKHKSSHYSCHKIHRIGKNVIYSTNGKINKNYDCIIGKICFDKNNSKHDDCNSWFQFEKTRTDTTVNRLKHSFDYLKHFVTRKNIGPFGYSKYTDKNPIILNFKP